MAGIQSPWPWVAGVAGSQPNLGVASSRVPSLPLKSSISYPIRRPPLFAPPALSPPPPSFRCHKMNSVTKSIVQSSNSVDESSNASKPVDSSQPQSATAPKTSDSQATSSLPDVAGTLDEKVGDVTEEVEEECGFCLSMKDGGFKEIFIAKNVWSNVAEKCFEVTGVVKKCMDAHADYYAPVLQAEKAMEEEAAKELGQRAEEKPPSEAPEAGR